MITQANAYWLDFFLRRDCNVILWNYRGYGESEQSIFQPNMDPHQQKVDVERVLQFLVNRIKVRGKIGAYGRSIGGIAASHLVSKFPEVMSVFIGDRTLGDFENIIKQRYKHGQTMILYMYRLLSCKWRANNVDGFLENKQCYKIHCFDQNDDVIDVFASHHHGLSAKCSQIDYRTEDWEKFYESLKLVFEMENELW